VAQREAGAVQDRGGVVGDLAAERVTKKLAYRLA
jgi:hypothetical protein